MKFTCLDAFGEPFEFEGELIEIKTKGFDEHPSGAWSLYGGKGATPARFAVIKKKGRRKLSAINVNVILEPKL